jgi:NADH-quinone oxidoreductase subunit L
MLNIVYIGLFLPLAGALLLMIGSSWVGRKAAGAIACGAVFLAFLGFATLFYQYTGQPSETTLFKWITLGSVHLDFTLMIDPLSLTMSLIITGVGFLIHVYSNGYMEHDEDFARYFAFMNFFVFAMLLLVLADNLLLLFVGWEGVGLASYLLIGYWYQRPAAAQAATKAFIVNRIGDLGLLLGLLLTFYTFGTGSMSRITQQAGSIGNAPLLSVIALLYFIGAVGKSAQLPLHSWLPDAMEGPTPVSALIHAATMVTAGVYLVARMHAVYMEAHQVLHLVGIIGGVTALFAALSALGQTDLKRVLAYSTVSQLGLMFVACGIGAFYAAIFHLTTHAFIKALLFLSAGNVVHMLQGETEMAKMGGLRHKLPATTIFFLIGVLGLSGIPPLAAFFSKDLILEQEYEAHERLLFWIAFAASALTACYMTRAFYLTFCGKPRTSSSETHEAPSIMIAPVACLALLACIGGVLGIAFGQVPQFEQFLGEVGITLAVHEAPNSFLFSYETWLSAASALFFVGITFLLYWKYAEKLHPPLMLLKKAFYLDEIYDLLLVSPLRALANLCNRVLEPQLFERMLAGAAATAHKTSIWLQQAQSGLIRSYLAWMVLGAVLLIAFTVWGG